MNYQIVIPARGGSKRLPKKNIKILGGLPLIAHSILYGLENNLGADVYVNTDCSEISSISELYGAKLVDRPKDLAMDITTTVDVLKHQFEYFERNNIVCDAIILLQATNPIRENNLLENAINEFEKNDRKSLATFSKLEKKFGVINKNKFSPKNYIPGQRSQDLTELFYETGTLYIVTKEAVMEGVIITEDVIPYREEYISASIDIDTLEDFLYAEYIFSKIK